MPAETLAGGESGISPEDGSRVNRGRPDHYTPRRDAKRHGYKHKDLMMMPARLAIALQDDGWWLRSEIVWHKPNPMPESVKDRPTSAHEKVFMLTKAVIPPIGYTGTVSTRFLWMNLMQLESTLGRKGRVETGKPLDRMIISMMTVRVAKCNARSTKAGIERGHTEWLHMKTRVKANIWQPTCATSGR